MSNREIEGEDGWVNSDSAVNKKLYAKGYSVGGYIDNGVSKYVLYRTGTGTPQNGFKFERVHEFDSIEELNNMLKLLLED